MFTCDKQVSPTENAGAEIVRELSSHLIFPTIIGTPGLIRSLQSKKAHARISLHVDALTAT